MSLVWTITALVASPFVIEYCFRIFVARRIQAVIESVPPLALIESLPSNRGRILTVQPYIHARVYVRTPSPRGVILFCPELDGGAESAPLYCQPLIDAGFAVVGIELSAASEQPPAIHWTADAEVNKVLRVLDHLSNVDFPGLPVGVFGVSRGGTVALIAACRSRKILSVLTDSGYSSMGLTRHFVSRFGRQVVPEWLFDRLPGWHIEKALWMAFRSSERSRGCTYAHVEREFKNLTQPVLLVSGKRDSYVTPKVTESLAELLKVTEPPWIVSKAKHNKARRTVPEEYADKTVQHFLHTLCGNTTDAVAENRRASVA